MSSGVDRCTKAEHAALRKSDKAWDELRWRKEWVFEDEVLEQRDCKCGSTLARKSKRVMFVFGTPVTIGPAIHLIRFYKGMEHASKVNGAFLVHSAAKESRKEYERAVLDLCMERP